MLVPTTSLVLGLYSTCALALSARSTNGYVHESANQDSSCALYWLEDIKHQGVASFNPNPNNYTVFRNVKSYGAVGDGITDDTAAIQKAITEGSRCAPSSCESSTNEPAIVYFPGGTYLISSSLIDYYYTQVCSPQSPNS
jgi:glucan 1,3-beta-glucosidase